MRWFALFLLFAFIMCGCTQTAEAPTVSTSQPSAKKTAYKPSELDSSFPVPQSAQKSQHRSKNPNLPYVRYLYKGLTNREKQNAYFSHLQQVGWREIKEEQMGAMHVFRKGSKQIHMSVHEDFFTLFIPQEVN